MGYGTCPGGVVKWLSSSPDTEGTGAMGREIESRQSIHNVLGFLKNMSAIASLSRVTRLGEFLHIG
jgi:hypothetical protein